jgi:integrase
MVPRTSSFTTPAPISPGATTKPFAKPSGPPALQRANDKYRTPYQTRHTFASMLLSRGENPLWVAEQMGHKDWGMIRKVYGRWIS